MHGPLLEGVESLSSEDREPKAMGGVPEFKGPLDEPTNVLRHYVTILRRRARWLIFGLVGGLIGGLVSTLFITTHPITTHYYKATNTLVAQSGPGDNSDSGSLQQAVLLVQSQALLDKVAQKVKMSPDQVGEQLAAGVRYDAAAIDVVGIATNPEQAANLANTAASSLNEAAVAASTAAFNANRDQINNTLNLYRSQRDELNAQIAANPPNADALKAQLAGVLDRYNKTLDQLQQLPVDPPNFTLSSLRPARPIEITALGYSRRRDASINAAGQVGDSRNTVSNDVNAASETNLSVGKPISKSNRVILGGVAGLVLGSGAAFLIEAWDDRLRRRERVEELTGMTVLAEIPKLSAEQIRTVAVPPTDAPASQIAERFNAARTSVLYALQANGLITPVGAEEPPKSAGSGSTEMGAKRAPVLMITSPGPSEGKSTSTASLAASFATTGMRTLVVDGDFRRPAVGAFLVPVPDLVDPTRPATTRIENLWFIAAPRGVDTPAEAVYELRRSIAKWQNDFDIILLDTPPMLTTNDASDLLAVSDAVLLVLRAGQSRTGPTTRAAAVLARFNAHALGVILNACDKVEMNAYYGSVDGYDYAFVKGRGRGRRHKRARQYSWAPEPQGKDFAEASADAALTSGAASGQTPDPSATSPAGVDETATPAPGESTSAVRHTS